AGAGGFLVKDTPVPELCRQLRAVVGGCLVLDQRVAGEVVRGRRPSLTPQERSVLALVAQGLTNREIGSRLYLSAHTVKEYLAKVMRRLGTHTRAQTVAKALQEGLIELPDS
ncbi:MAG: helix-turn-helix domain-containing protein, partial [Acidimicrobiia bacterium]